MHTLVLIREKRYTILVFVFEYTSMPELPEVQTVVSQLGRKIVGKKITRVWSDWQKKIFPSYTVFAKKIKNSTITGTRRLGKHIVIDLDNGYSIVAHLKMTGHFLVKHKKNRDSAAFADAINGYIHHRVIFSDGTTLEFSDMRKFGWLRITETDEVEKLASIVTLGMDALSPLLTEKRLRSFFTEKQKRSIGAMLLEQNHVAGIGNIYRSEALFLAGIVPTRRIETLTVSEWKKIVPAIKKVLRQAIKTGGTSDGDFRDTDGLPGRFQDALFVYGRADKPCKKCGIMVSRAKIGQRSIFYCSRCQK